MSLNLLKATDSKQVSQALECCMLLHVVDGNNTMQAGSGCVYAPGGMDHSPVHDDSLIADPDLVEIGAHHSTEEDSDLGYHSQDKGCPIVKQCMESHTHMHTLAQSHLQGYMLTWQHRREQISKDSAVARHGNVGRQSPCCIRPPPQTEQHLVRCMCLAESRASSH